MKNKASEIIMVSPARFGYNKQTASTNLFQQNDDVSADKIQERALKEFEGFVKLLKKNHVNVKVLKDTISPATPDSIFPNNIVSFHTIENLTVPAPPEMNLPDNLLNFKNIPALVIYPMMAKNRRREREGVIRKKMKGYSVVFDLSINENHENFLEGTGSIIFDYENQVAYASNSKRTNIELFKMLCQHLNYSTVTFSSVDKKGNEIYHTNVMMCIGKGFAVVCDECVRDKEELFTLMKSLIDTDHKIITINYKQLNAFAGNMYQLFNKKGESIIVMSEQGYKSLKKEQITKLKKFGKILHPPLYTIEKYGGGSARCMIADVR